MRKFVLILFLMVVNFSFVLGQTPQDSISVFEMNRGYQYFKGDKQLTADELAFAVRSNDEAYQMIRSAQASNSFAMILGYAGGFMIGWPIGTAIGGGEPNWLVAGVGLGVAVLGFSVGAGSERQVKKAVDLYNDGLGTLSLRDPRRSRSELRLSLSEYGVGLSLNF